MDVSGDFVLYCILNVLFYLLEFGVFGLIFVFFYCRWFIKCFGKLVFLKYLKFLRLNFLIFFLNWKVGIMLFYVSSILFFRICFIVNIVFVFYCSLSFCWLKIRFKLWLFICWIISIKFFFLLSFVECKVKESVRNNGGILREFNYCVGYV